MYIDFHPWECELLLILFNWDRKEFAKSVATCHVPETILIHSNKHIWHCGCDFSYHLLVFMAVYGHYPGSVPFSQGSDWWIKWGRNGNYNLCILHILIGGTNFCQDIIIGLNLLSSSGVGVGTALTPSVCGLFWLPSMPIQLYIWDQGKDHWVGLWTQETHTVSKFYPGLCLLSSL